MKKLLVFIINPKSGVDRVKAIQELIDKHLNQDKFSYQIEYTEFAGHGTQLAKTAVQNRAYAVVAVGGDGSVNDVIKGLYGSETKLAIIPKGSGNGLARSLSIPMNELEAIKNINRDSIDKIDLVHVNQYISASNAGVGFDAIVCQLFAKSTTRGLFSYFKIINQLLWTYKSEFWEIEIDGIKYNQHAFLVNIANGQQFGYNFIIAEKANWTDGLMDVIIIKPFPKIFAAILALRMMKRNLSNSKYVQHLTAKKVVISQANTIKWMQIDGESVAAENQKIEFAIQNKMLEVLVGY